MKKTNRKGFTLIEILATLIVLAIIAAITIPTVLDYTTYAANLTYLRMEDDFEHASKTYIALNYEYVPETIDGVRIITSDNLETNEVINPIIDPRTGQICDAYTIITRETEKKLDYQTFIDCDGYETDGYVPINEFGPSLELNGANPYYLEQGSTYIEYGADAIDPIDGIIEDIVITDIGTPLNNMVRATYTKRYSAVNSLDVPAECVGTCDRSIIVRDTTDPIITITGANPITHLVNTAYTDPGATATDNIDGNRTANITTATNLNITMVGSYYRDYTVSDTAGNTVTARRIINVYDDVVPTITYTPNGNASYAKSGSVNVNVTDNYVVDTSSLKYIWNNSPTPFDEESDFNGASTFVNNTSISLPTSANGNWYLHVFARDNANNIKISVSNAFAIDVTAPIITFTNINPSWYNTTTFAANTNPVSVRDATHSGLATIRYQWTTSASDPSGITSTTCTGGTSVTVTSGTTAAVASSVATGRPTTTGSHYLHVCAIDVAGNVVKSSSIYKLDTGAVCSIQVTNGTVGENGWYTSNVTVSNVSSESGESGIQSVDTTLSATPSYNNVSYIIQSTETAGQTVYAYIKDNANNVASCSTTIKLDKTAPTCSLAVTSGTMGNNSWYRSDPTITNTRSDALSGVQSYGTIDSATTTYNSSATFTQTTDTTTKSIYGYVKDNAGLTSSCSTSIKMDKTAPVMTITGCPKCGSWSITAPVTISWNVSADVTSGIAYQYWDNNSGMTSPSTTGSSQPPSQGYTSAYSESDTWSTQGNFRVYLRVEDMAGNLSAIVNPGSNNMLDTSKPTIVFTGNNEWLRPADVTTAVTVRDLYSGLTSARYYWSTTTSTPSTFDTTCSSTGTAISLTAGTTSAIDSTAATGKPSGSGTYYLHVCAKDVAGTSVTYSYGTYYFDTVAPIISFIGGVNWTKDISSNPIDVWDTAYSGYGSARYYWSTSTVTPSTFNSTCTSSGYAATGGSLGAKTEQIMSAPTGLPTTSGTYYLHVCAKDQAGNVNYDYEVYRLDSTRPTATVYAEYLFMTVCEMNVTNYADASPSGGTSSTPYSYNGGSWTSVTTFNFTNGNTTTVNVRDAVGNTNLYTVSNCN